MWHIGAYILEKWRNYLYLTLSALQSNLQKENMLSADVLAALTLVLLLLLLLSIPNVRLVYQVQTYMKSVPQLINFTFKST